jgi:S1-C subfamily serine protease
MMLSQQPPRQVLAPAAQWGMVVAKDEGDEEAGVTIKEVMPGSAAAGAGLKAGDRLLTLDGRWTDSVPDCYRAAGFARAGTSVKLTVSREGKELALIAKPVAGL